MIGAALLVLALGQVQGEPADATALTMQADAAHEQGRIAEAADLYVEAYGAMTTQDKEVLGDVIVGAALEDLRASHHDTADPRRLAAAGDLLDAYERDLGRPLPDADMHRAWIEAATEPPEDEPPPPLLSPRVDDEPPPPAPEHDRPPRERDVAGPVLLGVGLAVATGGSALIGAGAPAGRRAQRVREQGLGDPRFVALAPDDPRRETHIAAYDDYVRGEQSRGQALVAAGSVLAAVGVGLVVYGTVRLVRLRRRGSRTARIRPLPGGVAF